MSQRVLRMGMIGGGRGAFIGAVHRLAAALDHEAELTAGCFSSDPARSRESGRDLGVAPERVYGTWREMLDAERRLPLGERIDFVTIVTPNHAHFDPALAFIEAGFHVACDKPLVTTSDHAARLIAAAERSGSNALVTYNYSGYPMVKEARHQVMSGALGPVRRVVVEYNQGWLATRLEAAGQKQASWRVDPSQAGAGGAIGDIGSHAEQLLSYVTGLEIESICADLGAFVPGRRLDDDAAMLLRFKTRQGVQARGLLLASQVEVGHENDLRLRVHGERGSLEWRQEEPNALVLRLSDEPERILRRGNGYLSPEAQRAGRIPPGHPEGFLEAFANVYRGFFGAIRAGATSSGGKVGGAGSAGGAPVAFCHRAPAEFDFPGLADGARGVRFIERTVVSAASSAKWTTFEA
jgi:predicted dehydrogenase